MRAVVLKAKVAGVTARADGSASIRLNSPTLAPEDHAALMQMLDAEATVLVQCEEGGPSLHESKAVWEDKTPSQRLRGILYREFESNKLDVTFDEYYRQEMNSICEFRKQFIKPA